MNRRRFGFEILGAYSFGTNGAETCFSLVVGSPWRTSPLSYRCNQG